MEKMKSAIRNWIKNEEGMQASYPSGLKQYITESGVPYPEIIEFAAVVGEALAGDSSFWTLRYADKSPVRVGVDECEDYGNMTLYNMCNYLRKND